MVCFHLKFSRLIATVSHRLVFSGSRFLTVRDGLPAETLAASSKNST